MVRYSEAALVVSTIAVSFTETAVRFYSIRVLIFYLKEKAVAFSDITVVFFENDSFDF